MIWHICCLWSAPWLVGAEAFTWSIPEMEVYPDKGVAAMILSLLCVKAYHVPCPPFECPVTTHLPKSTFGPFQPVDLIQSGIDAIAASTSAQPHISFQSVRGYEVLYGAMRCNLRQSSPLQSVTPWGSNNQAQRPGNFAYTSCAGPECTSTPAP